MLESLLLSNLFNIRSWIIVVLTSMLLWVGVGRHNALSEVDKLNTKIEQSNIEYAIQLTQSLDSTNKLNKKVQEAQNEATSYRIKLQSAYVESTVVRNSLLSTTSEAITRLPEAAVATSNQYTNTLTDVFNDCSGKYLELAKAATSHTIDEQELISSYPTLEK